MLLWLHAYQYTFKELKVETDVPKWAMPEYKAPAKLVKKQDPEAATQIVAEAKVEEDKTDNKED